jgi:hypothetical protein
LRALNLETLADGARLFRRFQGRFHDHCQAWYGNPLIVIENDGCVGPARTGSEKSLNAT